VFPCPQCGADVPPDQPDPTPIELPAVVPKPPRPLSPPPVRRSPPARNPFRPRRRSLLDNDAFVKWSVFLIWGGGLVLFGLLTQKKSDSGTKYVSPPPYMSRDEWDYFNNEYRRAGMTEKEAHEAAEASGLFLRAQENRRRGK
jgi:hypothetical protein